MRRYAAETNYPYPDLLNLMFAHLRTLAGKRDRGEITEGDFQIQIAELQTRIAAEEQRRNAIARGVAAQGQAASGAQLQGLGIFLRSMQPR